MSDDRDPVVRDALDGIQVPPADGDFWASFDARLAAADPPRREHSAPVPGSGEPADLMVVPLARASRSTRAGQNRWYAVAAVAAAVVIALALTWRPGGDERDQPLASEPSTAPSAKDPAASSFAPAPLDATTPDGAVRVWLTAIYAGDLAAAEALTGPATIGYELATTGRSPAEFLPAYAEGSTSPFEDPGAGTLRSFAVGEFRGQAAQVVVVTRPLEAMELPTDSYPVVRTVEGTWQVEPAAFSAESGGRLELVSPEPGEFGLQPIAAGGPIEIVAEGGGTYVVAIDDHPVERFPVSEAADGGVVRTATPADLAPGQYLMVIARIDDDVFTAGAFQLTIAEG